jgi:iron complex transport system substrate-binding protein
MAQMYLLAIAPELLCTVTGAFSGAERDYIPDNMIGLPVVGQFYGAANLNLEEIAAIGPELVIDIGEAKNSIVEDMDAISRSTGIPAVHITAELDTSAQAFRMLGDLLGRKSKGEALAAFCERTVNLANAAVNGAAGKKSVLYCMGAAGTNVVAKGSFHAEVIDRFADNRAVVNNPSSRGTGNESNLEQIMLWNPEYIIFAPGSVFNQAATDPAWRQLRAVRDKKYYEVPVGPYNWMGSPPAINRFLGILYLTKILYPESASFDLYAETKEYYRLFYSYDLSAAQFEKITRIPAQGPR